MAPVFSVKALSPTTSTLTAASGKTVTNLAPEEHFLALHCTQQLSNTTNAHHNHQKVLCQKINAWTWFWQRWIWNWSWEAQSIDLIHRGLKWHDHVHGSNFLKQTSRIPTPTESDAEVLEKKEEWRRTLLQDAAVTIIYSQSVPECAIPVKGTTTGKDTQSYWKKKVDSLLSEGMMGDECALSSRVHHSLTVENRKAYY